MKRRELFSSASLGVALLAGCTGNRRLSPGGEVGNGSDSAGSSPTVGSSAYFRDLSFEKREATSRFEADTAHLEASVTEAVSRVTVVSKDGRRIGGARFPSGVTRASILSGQTFVFDGITILALDEGENELDSITATYRPEIAFSALRFEGEVDYETDPEGTKHFEREGRSFSFALSNTGNGPVYITEAGIEPTPSMVGIPGESVYFRDRRVEIDELLLPGETVTGRHYAGSGPWLFRLERRDGKQYIGNTDITWDDGTRCNGETMSSELLARDESGREYAMSVTLRLDGDVIRLGSGSRGQRTCEQLTIE